MILLSIFGPKGDLFLQRPLDRLPLVVGRSQEADLVLEDEKASRKHCVIEMGPDGIPLLRDLGSSNGLEVGGKKVERVKINEDFEARVGHHRLVFKIIAGNEESTRIVHIPQAPQPLPSSNPAPQPVADDSKSPLPWQVFAVVLTLSTLIKLRTQMEEAVWILLFQLGVLLSSLLPALVVSLLSRLNTGKFRFGGFVSLYGSAILAIGSFLSLRASLDFSPPLSALCVLANGLIVSAVFARTLELIRFLRPRRARIVGLLFAILGAIGTLGVWSSQQKLAKGLVTDGASFRDPLARFIPSLATPAVPTGHLLEKLSQDQGKLEAERRK